MASTSSKSAVPPPPAGIPGLRQAIQEAEAAGGDREAMTLHLTFRDAALIKRSREVGVDEVRFAHGVMHFIGVKVVIGDVTVSHLQAQ